MKNLRKTAQEWADEAIERRTDKGMKPADWTAFIPYAGGGIHGMLRPAEGASRLETAMGQGAAGFTGGVLGGLGGLGAGLGAAHLMTGPQELGEGGKQALALFLMASTLAGASVGTAGGTYVARPMLKRDVVTPEDLRNAMIAAQRARAQEVPAEPTGETKVAHVLRKMAGSFYESGMRGARAATPLLSLGQKLLPSTAAGDYGALPLPKGWTDRRETLKALPTEQLAELAASGSLEPSRKLLAQDELRQREAHKAAILEKERLRDETRAKDLGRNLAYAGSSVIGAGVGGGAGYGIGERYGKPLTGALYGTVAGATLPPAILYIANKIQDLRAQSAANARPVV